MLRLLKWPFLAVLVLALSGCATMTVSSHVQPGLDIARYHTWQWGPADALPANDARLNNPFFRDHFEGAIEKQFAGLGFEQVFGSGERPDLLVHYHASITPRISPTSGEVPGTACYDENCTVRVVESDLATMTIDVVDRRTGQLVWRGWAQTGAEGLLDRPNRFGSRIGDAVARMFARFPSTSRRDPGATGAS